MKRPSYLQQVAPRTMRWHNADVAVLAPPRSLFPSESARAEILELEQRPFAAAAKRSLSAGPAPTEEPRPRHGFGQWNSAPTATAFVSAQRPSAVTANSAPAATVQQPVPAVIERSRPLQRDAGGHVAAAHPAATSRQRSMQASPTRDAGTSQEVANFRVASSHLSAPLSGPGGESPKHAATSAPKQQGAMASVAPVRAISAVHPTKMSEPVAAIMSEPAAAALQPASHRTSHDGARTTAEVLATNRSAQREIHNVSRAADPAATPPAPRAAPAAALPVITPSPPQPPSSAARDHAVPGLHIGALEVRVVPPIAPIPSVAAPRALARPRSGRVARGQAGRITRGFAVFGLGQS